MKRTINASGVVLLATLAYGAERNLRFAKKLQIRLAGGGGSSRGRLRAAHIRSYSLRLYGEVRKSLRRTILLSDSYGQNGQLKP
jgi:hypothetical protein